MKGKVLGLLVAVGLCTQSCDPAADSACKNAASGPQIPVPVTRLEKALGELKDSTAAKSFLQANPMLARGYFYTGARTEADTAEILRLLVGQAQDPYMDTMRRDVLKVYPNVDALQGDLAGLFGRVQAQFPDFEPPKAIYTLASGFNVDVLYLDSLLILGLEHFMPDSAHYEPPQIPRYIRVRMRPNTIVPSVAKLISDRYNRSQFSPEQAMVEEMVRWGKVLYFQEQMLPCVGDTLIMGYSAQTLKDVEKNAPLIYAHFVDRNLFFNTDHLLRAKYVGERPVVSEIGPECPGRIGQWIGWQIVRKWAADKKLTLAQVMAEPDGRKIFNQARWKPE